jgi:hypothetical protein
MTIKAYKDGLLHAMYRAMRNPSKNTIGATEVAEAQATLCSGQNDDL